MLSALLDVRMCGEKENKGSVWGQAMGSKMGQLILSMGPAWVEVRILIQRATSPSKMAFFYAVQITAHALQ